MWEPIENAPKTGEELVVTDFQSPPQFAVWKVSELYNDGGLWLNRNGIHRELPTHFMKLPPPLQIAPPSAAKRRR